MSEEEVERIARMLADRWHPNPVRWEYQPRDRRDYAMEKARGLVDLVARILIKTWNEAHEGFFPESHPEVVRERAYSLVEMVLSDD